MTEGRSTRPGPALNGNETRWGPWPGAQGPETGRGKAEPGRRQRIPIQDNDTLPPPLFLWNKVGTRSNLCRSYRGNTAPDSLFPHARGARAKPHRSVGSLGTSITGVSFCPRTLGDPYSAVHTVVETYPDDLALARSTMAHPNALITASDVGWWGLSPRPHLRTRGLRDKGHFWWRSRPSRQR